ncbi:MAG: hypothetical protein CSA40_00365 [Flavobacteriales bacterium]|nr:MAG: hypothetical protein CSA40_00365 [Flavobacteriales bacterium]
MKFTQLTVFIALLLLIGSCTSNTIYKKPKDLISKRKMTAILTDLYIAKAAYHVKNTNLERNVDYTPLVYEKYGIDSLRFSRSNHYYMSRIDEYEEMHKEVQKRLSEMLTKRDSLNKEKDSLKTDQKSTKKELPKR